MAASAGYDSYDAGYDSYDAGTDSGADTGILTS